jgi:hypothetical protein
MTGDLKGRHTVNSGQAQQMFNKITGNLLKGDKQEAARDLLKSNAVDWTGAGGQKIILLMKLLGLSIADWREPDYVPLRDAYQLHNRRRRNPNAMLYPGDAEAMSVVSDALLYTPIFAGTDNL